MSPFTSAHITWSRLRDDRAKTGTRSEECHQRCPLNSRQSHRSGKLARQPDRLDFNEKSAGVCKSIGFQPIGFHSMKRLLLANMWPDFETRTEDGEDKWELISVDADADAEVAE